MTGGTVAPTYPTWWVAAQAECRNGHPAGCTYGGMTIYSGYWLELDECRETHGETCAACGADTETGFSGRDGNGALWQVATCKRHAEEILAIDPATWRKPGVNSDGG